MPTKKDCDLIGKVFVKARKPYCRKRPVKKKGKKLVEEKPSLEVLPVLREISEKSGDVSFSRSVKCLEEKIKSGDIEGALKCGKEVREFLSPKQSLKIDVPAMPIPGIDIRAFDAFLDDLDGKSMPKGLNFL